MRTYERWTLIQNHRGSVIEDADGNYLKFPEHIDGDVIIDFYEALQIDPWWKPQFSKRTKAPVTHAFEEDYFPINSWSDKERSKLLGRAWEWTYVESDGGAALEFNHFVAADGFMFGVDYEATDDSLNPATLELSPEDLALLPSRIFVYALRGRKFVNADIQYLEQSSVINNPFEDLEIEEEHIKDLIMSTVWEHFKRKKVRRDAQSQGLEMRDQAFIHSKVGGPDYTFTRSPWRWQNCVRPHFVQNIISTQILLSNTDKHILDLRRPARTPTTNLCSLLLVGI